MSESARGVLLSSDALGWVLEGFLFLVSACIGWGGARAWVFARGTAVQADDAVHRLWIQSGLSSVIRRGLADSVCHILHARV